MPSQELTPDLPASSSLVEALMARIIQSASFCYWNLRQEDFDILSNPKEYIDKFPITLGDLTIAVDYPVKEDPCWLSFSFNGLIIDTYIDGKRYSALSKPMSRYSIVDWFECLINHLHSIDKAAVFGSA